MLDPEGQSLLMLTYRDGLDQYAVSQATGVSVRAIGYKLQRARQTLAGILDLL